MKNKVYEIIGKLVVYALGYGLAIAGFVWAFTQNTIY